MCTLLVFAAPDNHHANHAKRLRGCWQRGMIVSVVADGVCREPPSPDSKLVFVHIPGIRVDQVGNYLEQTTERRRLRKIDLSVLPSAAKKHLAETREITITWRELRAYIRNLANDTLEG